MESSKLKTWLNKPYFIEFETPDDGYSYFFGYYDKFPLNKGEDKLLVHRTSFDGRDITKDDVAEIGYFDLITKSFIKLSETRAFNWQQGAHLQWLPPDYNSKIIFNDRRDGKFVSVIIDVISKAELKVLDFPIYAIHPSGDFALCVNYERLYFCRPGYNYQGVVNEKWDQPFHEDDGIFRLDIQTNKTQLIIPLTKIIEHKPLSTFERNSNWLEHIMFNMSGSRFIFFHRWANDMGSHYTRLYGAETIAPDQLKMFPDVRFYSHANWRNDDEFTIFSLKPGNKKTSFINQIIQNRLANRILFLPYQKLKKSFSKKIIKPIVSGYAFINYSFTEGSHHVFKGETLQHDGHMTWFKDANKMVFDTYTNKDGYRELFFINVGSNQPQQVGKFHSFYNDVGYRCDLHPRLNHDQNKLIIDSAHEPKRKVLIIKI